MDPQMKILARTMNDSPGKSDHSLEMDMDLNISNKVSSVLTLEPFSPHGRPFGHSFQRKQINRKHPAQNEILPGVFEPAQYRKFLKIKFDDKNVQDLDLFNVYKEIVTKCEKKPKLAPQNDGGLLVEVSSLKDSENLLTISLINGVKATCSPHLTLNQCKGVIFSSDLLKYSEDRLREEFAEQGVIDVKRIKKRENGEEVPSPLLILTFNLLRLPNSIQAAWLNLKVRPYVPRVKRCFFCQKFGHVRNNCRRAIRGQKPICKNCGDEEHGSCSKPPLCVNCNGNHDASSNRCTKYLFEKEILTLKVKERISYKEAKEKVLSQYPSDFSFASVARKFPPQKPNNFNTAAKRHDKQPEQAASTNEKLKINLTKRRRSGGDSDQPKFKVHNTGTVTTRFIDYNPFAVLQDEVEVSPSKETNECIAVVDDSNSTLPIPVCSPEQLGNAPAFSVDQAGVSVLAPSPKRAETDTQACSSMQAMSNCSTNLMELEETIKLENQKSKENQVKDLPRPLSAVEEELFVSASSLSEETPSPSEKVKLSTSKSPQKEKSGTSEKPTQSTKATQPLESKKSSSTMQVMASNPSTSRKSNSSSTTAFGGKIIVKRHFSKTSNKDVSRAKK